MIYKFRFIYSKSHIADFYHLVDPDWNGFSSNTGNIITEFIMTINGGIINKTIVKILYVYVNNKI